ncbi:MAG: hypothetical protein WA584_22315 [Pyrinomonadaceae bacterium]
MKREIKETKKILNPKLKAKISDAKPLTKKAQTGKVEKKVIVEIKPKAKKNIKIPATPVKLAGEKTPANKSKTKKQSAAIVNQKNKPIVKKTPVKITAKAEEKTKSTAAKGKISNPKTQKKSAAETKIKKFEAIKKTAVAERTVKAKTQIKTVAKSEKTAAKKSSGTVSLVSVKKTEKKTVDISKAVKPKVQKTGLIVSAEKSKASTQIVKPETQKKIAANIKIDKSEAKKVKSIVKAEAQVKKVKALEPKIVAEVKIIPKKPVIKKAKPISSAVLRGKKGRYDFEVFPLDANFEPVSAIYVISKRITDKRKRGHHKLVCIGQTESIVDGIKMHKKDKCIKQNAANVICLLKEDNEKNRLKIADDLREAHAIACNRQ